MKLWSNWRHDTWLYASGFIVCPFVRLFFSRVSESSGLSNFFFFFFGFWLGLVFINYYAGSCVLDSSNSRERAVDLLNKVKGPSCSVNFVRNYKYLSRLLPTANSWMTSVVSAVGNKNIRRKVFGKSYGLRNRKGKKLFCHLLLLRCY